MHKRIVLTSALTISALIGPAAAMAASETDVTEEELMDVLLDEALPAEGMMDRGGGGGMIYPMPGYGGGVTVEASVTKEVTPDFVAINAYCDAPRNASRETVRDSLNQLYNDIKNAVGKDGRVRKQGTPSVYPVYGPTGEMTDNYTGSISIFIRITNISAATRISDYVESKNCGANWDVRLTDTQSFETSVLDQLVTRLNKRKTVFEKLLKKKLNRVVSASIYTWADGYGTYDPETNKVEATTTLNVTFDLGGRATLPTPAVTPRG